MTLLETLHCIQTPGLIAWLDQHQLQQLGMYVPYEEGTWRRLAGLQVAIGLRHTAFDPPTAAEVVAALEVLP